LAHARRITKVFFSCIFFFEIDYKLRHLRFLVRV
jgi:hypothetical protein